MKFNLIPRLNAFSQNNFKRLHFEKKIFIWCDIDESFEAFNFFESFSWPFSIFLMAGLHNIPSFDKLTPQYQRLTQYIDFTSISPQQEYIISLIVNENLTREQIMARWEQVFGEPLQKQAICTSIRRTSLSMYWIKTMKGGHPQYLCKQDMEFLASEVCEHARVNHAFDANGIRQVALEIKMSRFEKAKIALHLLKAPHYSDSLSELEVKEPCRSWVNTIISKINSRLFYPVFIDMKRFLACTPQTIDNYFQMCSTILTNTPPAFIFTTDESMCDLSKISKVIIPKTAPTYIEPSPENIPHITGMFCTNVFGSKPPPMFIIKELKNCPPELAYLWRSKQIWLASSANGWMDRYTFLMWCVCFAGWIQEFRTGFAEFADKYVVLILDGHGSRENSLGIEILEHYKIIIIVLPSHTTHVLQLFDVVLASPTKKLFTDLFRKALQDQTRQISGNETATKRKLAIECMVQAWNTKCTTEACINGAKKVGIYPVSASEPKTSKYVRELTPDEQVVVNRIANNANSRLNINCSILNNRCDEIRTKLQQTNNFPFCCKKLEDFPTIKDMCRQIFRHQKSRMLGVVQNLDNFNLFECL